ncbi:hypothetical protein Pmani_004378 [Petrolisthes manimaculis]|uniref:DDB1- and CUL4-associated factor 13 n=1 Tax=Petrolisthes manimaculis TaxID=1843537 RepID=A0AAE1QE79_9EUCA|nr:hypothetical protein Pmani_004378 [Petrolisthes manimaculis]
MSIKKINVISRNPDQYLRETKRDIHKVQRNYDPDLHPFEAAREYKLALNAVKLEKVFAKPFIGSLTHTEEVSAISRHPSRLSCIFTGTVDGEVLLWDIATQKRQWQVQGHNGKVWCIVGAPDGNSFFTVGNDKTIKRWSLEDSDLPIDTWLCDTMVTGLTHHRYRQEFVTCGQRMLLWDVGTKAPKTSYDWTTTGDRSDATTTCVKFSPVQADVFASGDHSNNLVLYDTRAREVKKLKMSMRINSLAWNPMEAFILTAASEDYNVYSFDIRNFDNKSRVVCVHEGHTSAVTDIDYAPTGREFCTASFDKSIRIFRTTEAHSRDVYHGKRMFRVNCVLWSTDNKYILSGSSDHNVRIWKAQASEKMGILAPREKAAKNYNEELKNKFGHFPELRRIGHHRHLPKHIYNAKKEHRAIKDAQARKEANRRIHSRPGAVPFIPFKHRSVVGLQDEIPSTSGFSPDQSGGGDEDDEEEDDM